MTRTLLICLVLAACSKAKDEAKEEAAKEEAKGTPGAAEQVKIATPAGTVTTTTTGGEAGTATITSPQGTATFGAGTALPADFPLPVMPGATVTSSMSGQETGKGKGWMVTLQTKQKVAEVGAFYEKALADKGLKVTKVAQQSGDGEMIMLGGDSDKVGAAVTIGSTPGEGTTISLAWGAK